MDLFDYLKVELYGVPAYQYLLAFFFILLGFTLKRFSKLITDRLLRLTLRTKWRFDYVIVHSLSSPLGWLCVILGLYLGTLALPLPQEPIDFQRFFSALIRAGTGLILVWFLIRLTDDLCKLWLEKAQKTETKLDDQFIPVVRSSSKVFLGLLGAIVVLQNLGYSVTSLLAGVGLGGMALALASQDTISNLFGSMVIFLDRPFQVGDWIEVGEVEGTVEEVNIRTTRIRTFANSLITLPNSRLTTNAINNWSRMKKRRIMTSIGVTYDTPPQKVAAAVEMIRDLIRNNPELHDDFFLVNFNKFGPYSLDIFIYCFTRSTNWAQFMDAQQKFFLDIMTGIHALGLSFAFPTQQLRLEAMTGRTPTSGPDPTEKEKP